MSTMRRQVFSSAVKLFDVALMATAFGVAILPVLAEDGPVSFAHFLSIRIKLQNFIVFFALLSIWHAIFSLFELYDSKRMSSRWTEVVEVAKATSLCSLVLIVAAFLIHIRMVTPMFVVSFWVFSTVSAAASRVIMRTWLRRLRTQGHNSRNMLIVGTNDRAIAFARRVQARHELGYRILGFADQSWAESEELHKHGFPLVSDLAMLPSYLRRTVVDEVVLALPLRSFHQHACDIAALCEQQGIILRLLSDVFNLKSANARVDEFEGAALITHSSGTTEGWQLVMKRALDILLSLSLLILVAPLLLAVAVLIKLTSPGPVLFVQKRVGLNKRTFNICKFRTMVANAESKLIEIEHLNEVTGPVFKIKNDPRVTPLGRFLRKTSIDELPQLFNVLRGHMSLVGPRPLQLRDYELFTKDCADWQRSRFSVRPGITCLWQVNGRSAVPFEKWMELDLQYVQKWSFWLDLQILAKTIPAVLRGSGAA